MMPVRMVVLTEGLGAQMLMRRPGACPVAGNGAFE